MKAGDQVSFIVAKADDSRKVLIGFAHEDGNSITTEFTADELRDLRKSIDRAIAAIEGN